MNINNFEINNSRNISNLNNPVPEAKESEHKNNNDMMIDYPDCSICQEEIVDNSNIFKTTCNHVFHDTCMTELSLYSNKCPNCKATIFQNDIPVNNDDEDLSQDAIQSMVEIDNVYPPIDPGKFV